MRLATVFLALFTWPALAAETPSSIVGLWEIDLHRTFSEHLRAIAREHPERIPPHTLQNQLAAIPNEVQPSSIGTLTITDDEMVQTNPTSGTTISRYRVTEVIADSLEIEITGDDGIEFVAQIRFVEGGFAIRAPTCVDDPALCERKARHALEARHANPVAGANSTSTGDSAVNIVSESSLDTAATVDAAASTTTAGPAAPTWFYFRHFRSSGG